MMIKSIIFTSFLIASALATSSVKPRVGVLDVQPNFEYGQARREFRVHFSGLGDDQEFQGVTSATINIYRKGSTDPTAFHTYTISDASKQDVFYFLLNDAVSGDYEVEICVDTSRCSERNPAIKGLSLDAKSLACSEGHKNSTGDWVEESVLTIPMIKIADEEKTWVTQEKLQQLENLPPFRAAGFKSEWKKNGVSKNPSFQREKDVLYAAFYFNLKHFKDMFKTNMNDGQKYTEEFCARKYLLTANAHLVNELTKEVKYRFKTTLYLSDGGRKYFLSQGAISEVPVEMAIKKTGIDADGKYKIYVSLCATEKDVVESTFCTDPIIKDLTIF